MHKAMHSPDTPPGEPGRSRTGAGRWTGIAIVLVMAVVLVAGHLLPVQGRTYSHGAWLNIGHILGFGLAAWLLIVRPPVARWPWWSWALLLALFGLALESAQVMTPRDASVSDWLRDLAGVAVGTMVALAGRGRVVRRVAFIGAAVALGVAAAYAPLRLVVSYELRDLAFPVLDDLSGEWHYRLRPIDAALDVLDDAGERRLRVSLGTSERFTGVAWTDPVPDWRDYTTLVLAVAPADGEPIDLTLRIHDHDHNWDGDDRFRARITVPAEGATMTFPLDDVRRAPASRTMDMAAIRGVILYAKELSEPRVIDVIGLRLE